MTTSVESLVHDLDAKEHIRRLAADFAQGFDQRRTEQFAAVWADDAAWQPNRRFDRCQGKDEIMAMAGKIWADVARTHHFVVNHIIDVDGDSATGSVEHLAESLGRDGVWSRAASTNTDRYEKRDGRWLIVSRSAELEMLG